MTLAFNPERGQALKRFEARLKLAAAPFRRLLSSPIGVAGLALIGLVALAALVAPLVGGDPMAQVLSQRLLPPSAGHLFGTDGYGRDIFVRTLYGARYSLAIVALVLTATAAFGLVVGATAGYAGGWFDRVLMRVSDIFLAFPRLILAIAVASVLGAGLWTIVFAICATGWPAYARIARAESVSLRNAEFVLAAETIGVSPAAIVLRHIVPICLPAIVVRAAVDAPGVVLIAAGLGFLGVGLPSGTPEWGAMVADGRAIIFDNWWVSAFPGFFILAVGIGFNLVADALRDVLDPSRA